MTDIKGYREIRQVTPAYIQQVGDAWNDFFDALADLCQVLYWAHDPQVVMQIIPPGGWN